MVHHNSLADSGDLLHMVTPSRTRKLGRSDVHFPLSTPRRHRPSITETIMEGQDDMASGPQRLSVRVRAPDCWESKEASKLSDNGISTSMPSSREVASRRHGKTLEDLPLEIQGLVLDYLFGDIHSVTSTSTSLQPGVKRVSSAMRHPRRKALTDVALVSPTWRDLVQERIYRHIKIKGNRTGLAESTDWFSENFHLTKHIRHIEFWVPVWADKSPEHQKTRFMDTPASLVPASLTSFHNPGPGLANLTTQDIYNQSNNPARHLAENNDDQCHGFAYPFSTGSTSATLSEIFSHISCFFSHAQIFTLEGGHCKKSHMIRQFPAALFPAPGRRLDVLPNIRTFAMRGAWNIMRDYSHWTVIEQALPGVHEWHCSYAKPKPEAYTTIISILSHLPSKLRHINISLDGFYCKDGVEGNGTLASSPPPNPVNHHLCERLGRIAPQLETLSFTGRICECFFRTATEVARARKEVSRLRAIDVVVKSCCRLMIVNKTSLENNSQDIGETEDDTTTITPSSSTINATTALPTQTQTLIPFPHPHSDTLAGITNMTFIRSFERLILSAVKSLDPSSFPALAHIRIRFIDLDSACPLLNPYFVFSGPEGGRCAGVWNEEIVEALWTARPGAVGWEELGEGIEREGEGGLVKGGNGGSGSGSGSASFLAGDGIGIGLGVRRKPRAIRGSAYKVLADAR